MFVKISPTSSVSYYSAASAWLPPGETPTFPMGRFLFGAVKCNPIKEVKCIPFWGSKSVFPFGAIKRKNKKSDTNHLSQLSNQFPKQLWPTRMSRLNSA